MKEILMLAHFKAPTAKGGNNEIEGKFSEQNVNDYGNRFFNFPCMYHTDSSNIRRSTDYGRGETTNERYGKIKKHLFETAYKALGEWYQASLFLTDHNIFM